jgi:hypothetical protein
MSIAEQIMLGTQQQSKNWSVLSENLGRLGQQVGASLAMREYQKQAAAALPAMQGAYRGAMEDINRGSISTGYKKFMDAQFQFGASQNPLIAEANAQAGSIFENATMMLEKQKQRFAQYGGGGGIPATRIPTTEEIITGGFSGDDYLSPGSTDQEAQAIDQEAVDGLPAFGQEQGFEMRLAPEGRVDFGMSKYIPPQRIRDRAVKDVDAYRNKTPEAQIDYIFQIPETGVAPQDEGEMMDILGLGRGIVVPPSVAPEPTEMEIESKESEYTTKGGFRGKVKTIPKKKTKEQLQAEAEELQTFKAMVSNYNVAKRMIETNPQLKDIFAKAGGDITRIGVDPIDEETVNATIDGQPVGNLAVAAPQGMMSEAMALNTIISAPGMFGKEKGKYRFYPEEKPPEAPAEKAADGGMPAVQAAAPAKPVVPETEALRKQLTVFEEQEVKKTATERQNRIKQINKEIESLQRGSTQRYTGAGLPGAGTMATTGKTKAEIERDITKIEQLVAERDRLEGKTTARNLSPMDQQALDWANANPSDPRAQAIKQKLGL